MYFEEHYIYHIYNRGNNLQEVFFHEDNYRYFLKKIKEEIVPACNILSYCLLPNHFHLLVVATDKSCELFKTKAGKTLKEQNLAKRIGLVLSSYTQGINKRYKRIGSIFQPKTKAKCLNKESTKTDYLTICFRYIHQNPVIGGLVENIEDWPYSSFNEYLNKKRDGLCNIDLGCDMINLDWDDLYNQSLCFQESKDVNKIF